MFFIIGGDSITNNGDTAETKDDPNEQFRTATENGDLETIIELWESEEVTLSSLNAMTYDLRLIHLAARSDSNTEMLAFFLSIGLDPLEKENYTWHKYNALMVACDESATKNASLILNALKERFKDAPRELVSHLNAKTAGDKLTAYDIALKSGMTAFADTIQYVQCQYEEPCKARSKIYSCACSRQKKRL